MIELAVMASSGQLDEAIVTKVYLKTIISIPSLIEYLRSESNSIST